MASQSYKRVSRNRLCRICGKPDWCSYTPDAKTSFCARVVESADRVSRTGWGVFYHEKSLFPIEPFSFPRRPPPKRAELAPLEIRDFAYRTLIQLSPATVSKEIIDGEKGLRARKILDFENYGSLPQTQEHRRKLAREIRRLISQNFPDFVRQQKSAVAGLPGFWLDKDGNVQLWSEKDYSCPMMLIPFRASDNLVQACQIRFMCRKPASDSVRYVWLSMPDKSGELSCGSPLHFASYNPLSDKKPILVTEGALKADTALKFLNEFDILASAGVGCSHEEIIKVARHRSLFLAFDTDYYENPHVARAYAKLIFLLLSNYESGFQNQIKVLTWNPKIRGIDDALQQNILITAQAPFEWHRSLSSTCQKEVAKIIGKLDYAEDKRIFFMKKKN